MMSFQKFTLAKTKRDAAIPLRQGMEDPAEPVPEIRMAVVVGQLH